MRTLQQERFDAHARGWNLVSREILGSRIVALRVIAAKLDPSDERHDKLRRIEKAHEEMPR